jgi:hypothetical protein
VPKRNYGYEKRQKELTRQNKREEKRQRKLERAVEPAPESEGDQPQTSVPAARRVTLSGDGES